VIENQFKTGDECPCCDKGKLYQGESRQTIQFDAAPPIQVQRYEKKVLRCNACGREQVPAQSIERYTPEANSSVIVQRALGTPLNRLSRMQNLFGVQLAPSSLWSMAKNVWELVAQKIFNALCESAQGREIYLGDDTRAQIIEVDKRVEAGEKIRKGCYTSCICTSFDGNEIILYFTANKHCADNFIALFAQKNDGTIAGLMVDASSNSNPKLEWIDLGKCLSHGRRKFVDLLKSSKEYCSFFLEKIAQVYKNDSVTKEQEMSPQDRRDYHRQHSLPIMREIFREMIRLFKNKLVEPNSRLGRVFKYWLRHRYGLLAFTRVLGMPLDNNRCEGALRPIAVSRNGSYWFMTLASAMIWSGLFSLVFTCERNKINAYEYFNWLQRNWKAASQEPEKYLPWHFRGATEKIAA
jgi:hypothetical protein